MTLDMVAAVEEGVVEPVVLDAGEAEEGVDAVDDEGVDDGLAAGALMGMGGSWDVEDVAYFNRRIAQRTQSFF